jgi:hypothetical protein
MMLYDDLTSEKRQIFQLLRLQHQFFTIVIFYPSVQFPGFFGGVAGHGLGAPEPFSFDSFFINTLLSQIFRYSIYPVFRQFQV